MKGDRSRRTFRRERHLTAVRAQQGRVTVDADWNEQNDIVTHRLDWTFRDIIGRAAGPVDPDSFKVTIVGNAIKVSPGRFYVGGRLLENEAPVTLPAQPHLSGGYCVLNAPSPPAFDITKPPAGEYAVMLDSWVRHVTVLEMPALLEPALGGVDTATRHQSVWQIKLMKIANDTSCAAVLDSPAWLQYAVPSPARMAADTDTPPPSPDQCDLSPSGGYQGLENNLYHVEIHDPGPAGTGAGTATFKWAVDNASVATLATGWDNNRTLTIASMPGDFTRGFKIGDTVELIDVQTELRERPGLMLKVDDLVGDTMILSGPHQLGSATDGAAAAARQLRVRRWEAGPVSIPKNVNWLALGTDGVRVNFDKNVTYRTGDYWEIPARTATNAIEWPGGAQPPANIAHLMTPLARVRIDAAGKFTLLGDCRTLFPPLSAVLSLHYVGGDGQQAEPNEAGNTAKLPLARPLVVAVMRGKLPVVGAPVQFTLKSGAGTLSPATPVLTDSNGLASCAWSLDPDFGPPSPPPKILDKPQEVEARMLDDVGAPFGNPVRFGARVLGLIEMKLAGGDTQSQVVPYGDPDPVKLPEPLCVAVTRAGMPLADALVRFTPIDGGAGSLSKVGGGAGTPHLDVHTDAQGIARCLWTLLPDKPIGHVRAHLRKSGVDYGAPDVIFSANLIQLPKPGGACCVTVGEGADYRTVNEAIDDLLDQEVDDICLCLTAGDHELTSSIRFSEGRSTNLSIHGCGAATRLNFGSHSILAFGIRSLEMADFHFDAEEEVVLAVWVGSVTMRRLTGRTGAWVLAADRCAMVTVEDCELEAFYPNAAPPPLPAPPPPSGTAPAGGGSAARASTSGLTDVSIAAIGVGFFSTSIDSGFRPVVQARDLIMVEGYEGHIRIVRNRLKGAINVGGAGPDFFSHVDYVVAWKRLRVRLTEGGTLTIADNLMFDLRLTGEPARLLGLDGSATREPNTVKVPRLARLERNEIWAPRSVLAARYAFVDGNRFVAGGPDTEQLLVIVPREGDNDPTVKIVGNSGSRGSLIVATGFPDEAANRPLVIRS